MSEAMSEIVMPPEELSQNGMGQMGGPVVAITYCSQCNWMLRAAWMGQELLSSFGQDLGAVSLLPRSGGIYQIHLDGQLLWDRKRDGGFPDAKEVKQRIRDRLWPERDLGHIDRSSAPRG